MAKLANVNGEMVYFNPVQKNGKLQWVVKGIGDTEEFCQHLELCTEKVVVVHLADGDTITTRIHGTDKDIRAYYRVGSVLNMGAEHDRLVAVVAVDIMEPPGNAPHGPVNELQRQEDGAGV